MGGQPLLSKFLPFHCLHNPWKGLTLTHSGPASVALVDLPKTWLDAYLATIDLPVSPRNWQFTIPFCSCNQERQFLCDLEMSNSGSTWKEEAYQLPLQLTFPLQRKNFWSKERTGIHFTACTALHVSRAFRCPPAPFCARNFDE